jgi:hypothetical protein
MSPRFALILPFVLVIGAFAPGRLSASPTWFQTGSIESSDVVKITYAPGGENGGQYNVGQYKGTMASTAAGLSSPSAQTFQTFSVDLVHSFNSQPYEGTQTGTVPALNRGAQVNYLYQTYGTTKAQSYLTYVLNGQGYKLLTANDYAAALQIAIWDEIANNGNTTGPFSYSLVTGNATTVASLVSNFLAVAAHSTDNSGWYLQSASSQPAGYSQGQSFLVTPAPPTLSLSAVALCCVFPACYLRRRRAVR